MFHLPVMLLILSKEERLVHSTSPWCRRINKDGWEAGSFEEDYVVLNQQTARPAGHLGMFLHCVSLWCLPTWTTRLVTSQLLLIWLFQQDTSCRVAEWLDRHIRRTCANSSRSSPPKSGAGHTWLPVDGRTVLCVRSAGTEVLMN